MKKFLMIITLYIATLSPTFASGFGWYVSSFDWDDFIKGIKVLELKTSNKQKNELSKLIIMEITTRYEVPKKKIPFNFLSIEESPMSSLEFYWEEALLYANKELLKKGKPNNYFSHFITGKSSITLPKQISSNHYTPAFFILSPKDIQEFYNQLKEFSSKSTYPNKYRTDLLHLEGVLLKNSAIGERGLVFFGHD